MWNLFNIWVPHNRKVIMTLHQILTSILSKQGNNEKIAELKQHTSNTFLTEYLHAMLSPRINFFIRKYKQPIDSGNVEFTQDILADIVDKLSTRKLTGNAAVEYVNELALKLTQEGQELLKWLLDKGMRGGIGIAMVNKAYGCELVWDSGKHYMRCSLPNDKLISKFDWSSAVCQVKYDGAYIEAGQVIGVRTRSGNCFPEESQPFDVSSIGGIVMGEIVIYENGAKLPRQESNGIINSALQGTPIPDKYKAVLHAWDWRIDDGDCHIPYAARLDRLKEKTAGLDFVKVVETQRVNSYEEALQFAAKQIQAGEEGAILKSLSMPWESGTSKKQIKLKVECDVDLLAVELVAGNENGKHADTFGSIRCQTSDGKLVVDVSGISDEHRQEITLDPSLVLGKVVTVTFNDILETDSSDTLSLFLPRFGNKVDGKFIIRHDKTTADDLPRILDIFESATGIRKKFK